MGRNGIRQSHGWGLFPWIVLAVLAVLYVSQSTRAITRLRSYPPPEFVELNPDWSVDRRQAERNLARAYWECALTTVQWEYSFASTLPSEPPAQFNVEDKGYARGNSAISYATRLRYWRKLQQVWSERETWEKSYEWDPYRIFKSGNS